MHVKAGWGGGPEREADSPMSADPEDKGLHLRALRS